LFGEFWFRGFKSIGKGSLHWRAFVYWISSFLLFGRGFDTTWLFITCMYFFPFHYRLYSWVYEILIVGWLHKSAGKSPLHWMASVYWISSFLLFGHGFDTTGLFITSMSFLPFHYRLCAWVWGILIASS